MFLKSLAGTDSEGIGTKEKTGHRNEKTESLRSETAEGFFMWGGTQPFWRG